MKRNASAQWSGDLKQGKGSLTTQSHTLNNTPYSFTTRFEGEPGTNPEELIAAAHAGCFTMALSAFLGKAGFTADQLKTDAQLSLEQIDGNWTLTEIHLTLQATIKNIDKAQFDQIVQEAKENCPVSRALHMKISVTATLN